MNIYYFNGSTNAIIADNRGGSVIFEGNTMYEIENYTPTILIKKYCINNGSTFEGRLKSTEFLTGYKYKAPILLKENTKWVYFPTNSSRLKTCSWLNLANIKSFYKVDNGVRVIFTNNVSIILNVSYFIFNNQFLKANYLATKLEKNKS